MSRQIRFVCVVVALTGVSCVTQQKLLDQNQATALETATKRGQFEMNCPSATAEVISREVVQPAIQGPWARGIERAEYTIGVKGCGERKTFVVICPEGGSGCFAAGPGPFHRY